MDQLIKTLHKDHDILILSGGYDDLIKRFLAKYNLSHYIKELFAQPTSIAENGQMTVHPIPKAWGGPCKSGGGIICKVSVMNYYLKDKKYNRIMYVGDGPNDVCPAPILRSNDLVCPRIEYKMESMLKEYCVQAEIVPWNNGLDILHHIRN